MQLIRLKKDRRSCKKTRHGRRGSATVLLCFLFVTLMGALAVTYEVSERKAAICIGEAAFDNAGRSVLACYDKELFERYGLFAFEGDEEKTEQRLEKVAKASIEGTTVAGCKVKSVEAEQSAYSLSDPDNLMIQIREITKRTLAADSLGWLKNELGTARKKAKEKKQTGQEMENLEKEQLEAKKKAQEAVNNARTSEEESEEAVLQEDSDPSQELEEIENAEREQDHMKDVLNSMDGEPSSEENNGRELKNGRIINSLPSSAAGKNSTLAGGTVIEDFGEEGASEAANDDLVTVAYIDHFFRNKIDEDSQDQNFFRCEMEYILFGAMSDKENYRNTYLTIFAIRTAANLASIYIDTEKRNLTFDAATAITPMPCALLTQLLIVSIWASLESYNDMKNLENGRAVPMIKNDETWMTDLDSVINLIKGGSGGELYIPIPEGGQMTYSRYLDMLLLTVERDTKLYRIMDLIQINLKGTVREDFTIADHFTGFVLKSEIRKKSHAVGVRSSTAEINMTHTYLTGG